MKIIGRSAERIASATELMRTLPPLSLLPASQRACLMRLVQLRSFRARASILAIGQPPDGLYILVSGCVWLRHEDRDGRSLIADTFGPKEFFGEMGLLGASPFSACIEAVEDCEILHIGREALLECLRHNAAAALCMLRIALTRLDKAHRQIAILGLLDVYGRVTRVLMENSHSINGEWHVSVGSEQIASMVAASREMVTRVLGCMIQSACCAAINDE